MLPSRARTNPEPFVYGDGGNVSDAYRNAPQRDLGCLYTLIGEVGRAGSKGTETRACAIAADFMA